MAEKDYSTLKKGIAVSFPSFLVTKLTYNLFNRVQGRYNLFIIPGGYQGICRF